MKAALIGAGQIARQHLTCLRALPGVELAAICDLSPATAEATAERCGIRAWFTDHRAMLEKTRPELKHVTIAGDFRRGCELVADLGLVAEAPKSDAPALLGSSGLKVHLTDRKHFGASFLHATGSAEHLHELRSLAERRGMRGSPTFLIDGHDPFHGDGKVGSLSCRLYRVDVALDGAPSVRQLIEVITQ